MAATGENYTRAARAHDAEHIARQLYPTPPAGDPPGPPWVLVFRLPDHTTPVEALTREVANTLPDGTRAWALAAGPARAVLDTIPETPVNHRGNSPERER